MGQATWLRDPKLSRTGWQQPLILGGWSSQSRYHLISVEEGEERKRYENHWEDCSFGHDDGSGICVDRMRWKRVVERVGKCVSLERERVCKRGERGSIRRKRRK